MPFDVEEEDGQLVGLQWVKVVEGLTCFGRLTCHFEWRRLPLMEEFVDGQLFVETEILLKYWIEEEMNDVELTRILGRLGMIGCCHETVGLESD